MEDICKDRFKQKHDPLIKKCMLFLFYWHIVVLQWCVSFGCTANWISCMCIYIPSFLDFIPFWVTTEYWAKFPVLYSRSSFSSVQFTQSCPTLWDPMDSSTPGLPVHHQLPEFTQTHVHLVGDGIQPSHPLSSPSPPTFDLSQHQGLFKWVIYSHKVAKVLEFQLQH